MYKYETHLHTAPVSRCGRATVEETLDFYAGMGYAGVFLTNHFLDGNVNIDDPAMPYKEKLEFYLSDYEQAVKLAPSKGIQVFFGVELSYLGSDFLIYGLDPDWYFAHPEIMEMKKSEELPFIMEQGGLVIHAHPFREAFYIDHIRLYPQGIHGVEVINACRTEHENQMAMLYADGYNFVKTAGSDNHAGPRQNRLAGVLTDTPLKSPLDYKERVLNREISIFHSILDENGNWKEQVLPR